MRALPCELPPVWAGVAAITIILLSWSVYGRKLYAVGTNPLAAFLAGINVKRVLLVPYVVSGATAAVAGVLLLGFYGQAFSDMGSDYTRIYVSPKDEDVPGFSVFSRRDGIVRHFYSGEMSAAMADPGQDPRGAPDPDPLWQMLDLTPQGRGTDWYPKLEYKSQNSK